MIEAQTTSPETNIGSEYQQWCDSVSKGVGYIINPFGIARDFYQNGSSTEDAIEKLL